MAPDEKRLFINAEEFKEWDMKKELSTIENIEEIPSGKRYSFPSVIWNKDDIKELVIRYGKDEAIKLIKDSFIRSSERVEEMVTKILKS